MDKYKIKNSDLDYNFKAENLDFTTTAELSSTDKK